LQFYREDDVANNKFDMDIGTDFDKAVEYEMPLVSEMPSLQIVTNTEIGPSPAQKREESTIRGSIVPPTGGSKLPSLPGISTWNPSRKPTIGQG
jgi:hypothetical protein